MTALANAFLVAFAIDGALSLLDEGLMLPSGSSLLAVPRALVALGVSFAALPLAAVLALTPRLPLRVFLPLVVFTVWVGLGAYPVAFRFESAQRAGVALSLIQLGLALSSVWMIRRRSSSGSWLLDAADLRGPAFRFGYTLRFALVTALLVPPALAAYGALFLAAQIDRATAGFMTFDLAGINSTARDYHRGNQHVHLVGMMHVGEDDAYRELFESFAGESTVVLEEGVTDTGHRLGSGLFYDKVAARIGLEVQPTFEQLRADRATSESGEPWPDVRNADVDTAVFAGETIALLQAASEMYQSDDLGEGLRRFQSAIEDLGPEVGTIAVRDLIEKRNARLVEEIRVALDDYGRVVVPWGALHLPEIERVLLEWGFEQTGSSRRQLSGYATIVRALSQ